MMYVQERSKALLKLRVMDKNKLMSDVDLGAVMTGLDALLEKPGRRVQLPLKGVHCGVWDVCQRAFKSHKIVRYSMVYGTEQYRASRAAGEAREARGAASQR